MCDSSPRMHIYNTAQRELGDTHPVRQARGALGNRIATSSHTIPAAAQRKAKEKQADTRATPMEGCSTTAHTRETRRVGPFTFFEKIKTCGKKTWKCVRELFRGRPHFLFSSFVLEIPPSRSHAAESPRPILHPRTAHVRQVSTSAITAPSPGIQISPA